MKAFRIALREVAATAQQAFSGDGGFLASGRWHLKGQKAVYASSSLALAAMERLVHLKRTSAVRDHVWYEIEVPDAWIHRIDRSALPSGWDADPPGSASQRIGTDWLMENASPALLIPSVVVRSETNLVLNPLHRDFSLTWVRAGPVPFKFDPRLVAAEPP